MRGIKTSQPVSSVNSTAVDLPRIIVPIRHIDDRGWFSETFHQSRLHDVGIMCRFVQDNRSSSKQAGTLRGLHFQRPPAAQAKLVSVLRAAFSTLRWTSATARRPTENMFVPNFRLNTAVNSTFQRASPWLLHVGRRCRGDVQGLQSLRARARRRDLLERSGYRVSLAVRRLRHRHLG